MSYLSENFLPKGTSLKDVIELLESLDIIEHPNKTKYPNQNIFIVDIDEYVYLVPFAEDEEVIFLKTIIPSRKMTKKYLGENNENE